LHLAHLAQANRHIAELTVEIVRQREIVKHALDTGQRSEIAVSLLDALEGSLRLFEKHRTFLLSLPQRNPRMSAEWTEMKMLDKTKQSDRPIPNENPPESCYCSALPKGSGPCLPCYTRWLAGRRS
jgi:hypothetical protein